MNLPYGEFVTKENKMDTGLGKLEPYDKNRMEEYMRAIALGQKPKETVFSVFEEGEELMIKGSKFKVLKVHEIGLVLQVLPQGEQL